MNYSRVQLTLTCYVVLAVILYVFLVKAARSDGRSLPSGY
jgi:hypothetical protein